MRLHWVLSVVLIGVVTLTDENISTRTGKTLKNLVFGTTEDIDAAAPTPKLVSHNKYAVETHHVKTEDGYILEMHRIPGSPTCPPANNRSKPIAFLMHGIFSSSADWLLMGPGSSIAYLLADAGYDVWLGNARGNRYSRNHNRTVSDEQFWDFSWHEIGHYDLPAMIDYALEETGEKQLVFIGYSQGTTTFYVMASTRPEYNVKIRVMFSLAPVAYIGRLFNPWPRALSFWATPVKAFLDQWGIYQFFASPRFEGAGARARSDFCSDSIIGKLLCKSILFIFVGFDTSQLDVDSLRLIYGHIPAGGSVRSIAHFGQGIRSHKFRQYDFGDIENTRRYGSPTPPDYNLSSITAPVHLFHAENDWFSDTQDVTQLYQELGNPIEMFRVPHAKWAHFDYAYRTDAETLVYKPIMNTLANTYGFPYTCA